jgi:hypothetical protein
MRRPVLLIVALLALALCPIARAELPKLTPAEISAGWLMLFDGETDFGWKSRGDAKWSVKDGELTVEPGTTGMLATTTEFADFELKAEVWIDEKANSGIYFRAPLEGEITAETSYEANVNDRNEMFPTGSLTMIRAADAPVKAAGKWTSFTVTASGNQITIMTDGKKTADVSDTKYKRGVIGLQYDGEGVVRYRNIRLRPIKLESIFNGKDLTGWKPFPDRPSVFSVTPEGWLNVKNGNGDLQTEKSWGDFVLQLEIISNGKHLNSGIFYRANLGKFWEGYEAQIRNQWEGEDRTKPVDIGTGGIYNRQKARKVVSTDKEWFTMTVIATGQHHATWVNGYQVADFTDTAAPSEANARNGSRTTAGSITIQGHDPTTDLSFRNIRVAEYPKAG